MNLLVDIGNTRLKWLLIDLDWLLIDLDWLLIDTSWLLIDPGLAQADGATQSQNAAAHHAAGTLTYAAEFAMHPTSSTATSSSPSADFVQQLDAAWAAFATPQRVVLASVAAPDTVHHLHQWLTRHWPATPVHSVLSQKTQLGVTNAYLEPARLGSDRWAALIGAHGRPHGPLCLVDAGTALTLDALDADGTHLGGVILPGIELARRALLARASGIAGAHGDERNCFAHSTADGVAAGTLYGSIGAIEAIVAEFATRLGKDMRVLLTGGDAPRLSPHLHKRLAHTVEEVPDLVMRGLARIAESLK